MAASGSDPRSDERPPNANRTSHPIPRRLPCEQRDQVSRLIDGKGVDVVVDPVGGDRFTDSLRTLAPEGRLIVIGFTGREIPTVKVNRLLLTSTTVMGAASEEFWQLHPGYATEQWNELMPLIRSDAIDPPIGEIFSLEETASAPWTNAGRSAD
jgi:NADPH:quinone reductase